MPRRTLGYFPTTLKDATIMSSTTGENTNTEKGRHTHVMFVENDSRDEYQKPLFFYSLKEASDEAEKLIKTNPEATAGIYQLRADLRGEIKIIREDFGN